MTDKQLLDIFKALSNETRLHILQWLKTPDENFPKKGCVSEEEDAALQGAVCVCAIGEKAGISQSTVSQYLETMERAGLLTLVRRGKWTYYRRNEETLRALSACFAAEL